MTKPKIIIKDSLAKKIYKLSEKTNKNYSYHINKAFEEYIAEQEDITTALERLTDKNDLVISSKQLRKSLGL